MPARWINLFHVTTYEIASRILDSHGIDPKLSQGKRHVSWYVTRKMVPWAIIHVIHRHSQELSKIVVLSVKAEFTECQKTSKQGVFCTREIYYPHTMDSAAMWLSREEKYIHLPGNGHNGRRWSHRREQDED